jgi:hypothetical protein
LTSLGAASTTCGRFWARVTVRPLEAAAQLNSAVFHPDREGCKAAARLGEGFVGGKGQAVQRRKAEANSLIGYRGLNGLMLKGMHSSTWEAKMPDTRSSPSSAS